jgi:hypothetical protein
MGRDDKVRRGRLLLGILAGLLAFAAGAGLAEVYLPEWRADRPAPEDFYQDRYRELARRAGLTLEPGEPRVRLVTRGPSSGEPYRLLGEEGSAWLEATKTGVRVEVLHDARGAAGTLPSRFVVDFSMDGRPEAMVWTELTLQFQPPSLNALPEWFEKFAPLLLQPGESMGPIRKEVAWNSFMLLSPVRGGERPQHLLGSLGGMRGIAVSRRPGARTDAVAKTVNEFFDGKFAKAMRSMLGLLALVLLFFILVIRSRISVINAAVLTAASLFTLNPAPGLHFPTWFMSMWGVLLMAVWIFLLWSCAESLLRSTDAGFTTSLDALRAGRLGPRGGRALLVGFAFGAVTAGLHLGLMALAEVVPGPWPAAPTVDVPFFNPLGGPLVHGVLLAGFMALSLALATRLLPLRWAPVAAALAAGAAFQAPGVQTEPYAAALVANTAVAGLLVWVCRRHGLTALLTAAVVSVLLPAALFSAHHLSWMPGSFALTAGLSLGIVALGWRGLARPAAAEVKRLEPPGFVRRLEEERRLKDEMKLLARMQRGLLPKTLPKLPGWELAARSVIANEAGGDLYDVLPDDEGYVWIAAGDVAGHGYSCAVAQAMTKAALASLVGRGRTPAEVLHRVDRVLRAAGTTRNFTTLALLRLRPETGEGLIANAGHPYPLLAVNGRVSEVAIPGFPLGMGPAREYADHRVHIPPGGALVFCSDGLMEALDRDGSLYGFERASQVLGVTGGREAEKILESLFADWRHHLRTALPLDDTTIVVLRHQEGVGA